MMKVLVVIAALVCAAVAQTTAKPQKHRGLIFEFGSTGPVGPVGPPGLQGLNGTQGIMGIQGIKGETGDAGPRGVAGEKGETGDAGRRGVAGAIGATGPIGNQGAPGPVGAPGDAGAPGIQGVAGPAGVRGAEGMVGLAGADGLPGVAGVAGPRGRSGSSKAPPCFDDVNRFADCGDGSVHDQKTGLIWLKQTNCNLSGNGQSFKWQGANEAATRLLQSGLCGLSDGSIAGDWRLPTLEEAQGIIKSSCSNPALPDTVGNGCAADGSSPFTITTNALRNFPTSSFASNDPNKFRLALFDNGTTLPFLRDINRLWEFWAVRSYR